jgi:hypothetical protein
MVLVYSAVSLLVYILAANIDNRFVHLYRKVLPFALIPLVSMQLASSYIRIDAYGMTESRYYIVLFGIYSIACGLYLIISRKKNTNAIVILATCFALVSIIPPIDAISVSMRSQAAKIEEILVKNNMLKDNKLVQNPDISNEDKYELTNKTDYMMRMGYLKYLKWMPEKYYNHDEYYRSFQEIYGFSPFYSKAGGEDYSTSYVYAMLNAEKQIDIAGFDTFFKINVYSRQNTKNEETAEFTLNGESYFIRHSLDEKGELVISVMDSDKNIILETPTNEFIDKIFSGTREGKELVDPELLTIDAENEKIKVRLIFNDLNIDRSVSGMTNVNGNAFVFFKLK